MREVLLPLMESLRLVWVLSTHYSDDAKMASLLHRIAMQIGTHTSPPPRYFLLSRRHES